MNCLYLNNSGSRWIIPGGMQFASLENTCDDKKVTFRIRTADYFEAVGNFARVAYRVKGKRYFAGFDDFYRYKGLPIVNRTGIAWHDGAEIFARMLGATIE